MSLAPSLTRTTREHHGSASTPIADTAQRWPRAHESTPQARSRALKVITAERDALAAIVLKIWGIRDASLDGRLEPGQAVAQLDDVISSWLEDAWPMATITQLRTSHAHPTTDTPPDP